MLSFEEITRSLLASWRMLRGDLGATAMLDRSVAGFWRSFGALFLVLPFEWASTVTLRAEDVGAFDAMVADLPLLVLDFLAFPVVLAMIARPLGLGGGYVSYVVARNWVQPISAVVLTVPIALQRLGMPTALATFVLLVALGIVLRLYFRLLREVLGASFPTAAGLFVLDIVLVIALVTLFT